MIKRNKVIAVLIAILIVVGAFAATWYYWPSSSSLNRAQELTLRASDLQGGWRETYFDSRLWDPDYPSDTNVSWIRLWRGYAPSTDYYHIDAELILMIFNNESNARQYYESSWVLGAIGNDSTILPISATNVLVNGTKTPNYPNYASIFQKGEVYCLVACAADSISGASFTEYAWLMLQAEMLTSMQYDKVFSNGEGLVAS